MKQAMQIKKVDGCKSVVINDIEKVDLMEAYKTAKVGHMMFYVIVNGRMQVWGLQHVADFVGIDDISVAFKYFVN